MKAKILVALAAVATGIAIAPAAQAQTVVNGCPTASFQYGGGGNDYTPCNTYVQTFVNGGDTVELDSRWHIYQQTAPASVGNTYLFSKGTLPLSVDFGVLANYDLSKGGPVVVSLTNLTTGVNKTFPASALLDNYGAYNLLQNSERLNFNFLFGASFDPNTDVTYRMDLSFNGNTSTTFAQIGAGTAAVPEPATWAMMIVGFGLVGGAMRRRTTKVAFA